MWLAVKAGTCLLLIHILIPRLYDKDVSTIITQKMLMLCCNISPIINVSIKLLMTSAYLINQNKQFAQTELMIYENIPSSHFSGIDYWIIVALLLFFAFYSYESTLKTCRGEPLRSHYRSLYKEREKKANKLLFK